MCVRSGRERPKTRYSYARQHSQEINNQRHEVLYPRRYHAYP
jgi:hypothetical protein